MVIRRDALHRAQRTARGRLSDWRTPPRRAAIAAAVAGFMVLAGLGTWPLVDGVDVYRTGLNERRVVTLKDGSKVSLDAMSKISVRYSDDARRLTLQRGQARFDVAHDVSRPFSVRARDRTVVATGTATQTIAAQSAVEACRTLLTPPSALPRWWPKRPAAR